MPRCQNEECNKRDLKKDEVVFDTKNFKVLCVPCGQAESTKAESAVVGVESKIWYGLKYTSDQGLKAELITGGVKMAVSVSNDQFKSLLGS
jgi:hypothetical protein